MINTLKHRGIFILVFFTWHWVGSNLAAASCPELDRHEAIIREALANRESDVWPLIERLESWPGLDENERRGKISLFTAEYHYYNENWQQAAFYYSEAIGYYSKQGNLPRLAVAYNNLGLVYSFQGEFDKALDAYSKSLEIEIELDNQVGIAQCYQNIAIVFNIGQETDRAIEFFEKAAVIFERENQLVDLAAAYNNIGMLLAGLSRYNEAEYHYNKSVTLYRQLGMARNEARVICNFASLMVRRGDLDKGGELLEYALLLLKQENDGIGIASAYSMLGNMYLKEGEYELAIYMLHQANRKTAELGLDNDRVEVLFSLYNSYKGLQEWQKALLTYEQYVKHRDSILLQNPEFRKGVLDSEIEYKIAAREARYYRARLRGVILGAIAVFAGLILLGVALFALHRRALSARAAKKRGARELLRKARVNTNFIFSLIEPASVGITGIDPVAGTKHLKTEFLDAYIENEGDELIPLGREIKVVNAFFDLYRIRYNAEVLIRVETVNLPDNEDVVVPSNFMLSLIYQFLPSRDLQANPVKIEINIAFLLKGCLLDVVLEWKGGVNPDFDETKPAELHKAMWLIMDSREKGCTAGMTGKNIYYQLLKDDLAGDYEGVSHRLKFNLPLVKVKKQ